MFGFYEFKLYINYNFIVYSFLINFCEGVGCINVVCCYYGGNY